MSWFPRGGWSALVLAVFATILVAIDAHAGGTADAPTPAQVAEIAVVDPATAAQALSDQALAGHDATEHWYVVEVAGEPAGWMVLRERQDGELVTSESILRLGFRRAGTAQTMGISSGFVETAEGRPVRAWSRQDLGAVPVEASYELAGEVVEATYRQGEARRSERLPAPAGEWLTPAAVERRVAERLASGVGEFNVRTVDPSMGMEPFTVSWQRVAAEVTVEIDGERHAVSRWRQVQSVSPGLATVVDVDSEGLLLRSETPLFGTTMTVTLADRDSALRVDGTPELLVASFVTPDRPIAAPRRLERAVFALRLAGGGAPDLPSTGAQRARREADRTVVEVDLRTTETAAVELGSVEARRYLAATTYLDHDHPEVAALAARAESGTLAADEAARVEALRSFVARYLDRKDLNSVLATASEVAATRAGDCTEHAVLLAALLRAVEIPSRVVTGLVYLDSFAGASAIFGYHMWTQALVDGSWVDYDATLDRRFDATHIAIATSALDDGSVLASIGGVTPLIGRLEISVLEPRE